VRRTVWLAVKPGAPELAIILGVADGRLDCAWPFDRPHNLRVLPRQKRGASDVLTGSGPSMALDLPLLDRTRGHA